MTIRDRLRRLIPMSVRQARNQWRDRILDNERHSELVGRRNFLRSASKAIAFNGITGEAIRGISLLLAFRFVLLRFALSAIGDQRLAFKNSLQFGIWNSKLKLGTR